MYRNPDERTVSYAKFELSITVLVIELRLNKGI